MTTMIGFGIDSSLFNDNINYIESYLIGFKVPYKIVKDKHISLVQITEKVKKDEMVRLINSLDFDISFRPKKISILYGKNFDFITLELHTPDNFINMYNKLKEKYNIVDFGDIRPHISLFKIPAGIAGEDFMMDVMSEIDFPKKIKIKEIGLWGSKFELEYTKNRRI